MNICDVKRLKFEHPRSKSQNSLVSTIFSFIHAVYRCSVSDGIAPPSGFVFNRIQGTAPSQRYVQRSGTFYLFSIGGNNELHFRTYFDLCHGSSGFNNDQLCINVRGHTLFSLSLCCF